MEPRSYRSSASLVGGDQDESTAASCPTHLADDLARGASLRRHRQRVTVSRVPIGDGGERVGGAILAA